MNVIANLAEWRAERSRLSGSVGFVPTMGALHAGHTSLVARARAENDVSVVSIYVNPTQFDDPRDLANYPRTLESDLAICRDAGVDCVFAPADMRPVTQTGSNVLLIS